MVKIIVTVSNALRMEYENVYEWDLSYSASEIKITQRYKNFNTTSYIRKDKIVAVEIREYKTRRD